MSSETSGSSSSYYMIFEGKTYSVEYNEENYKNNSLETYIWKYRPNVTFSQLNMKLLD